MPPINLKVSSLVELKKLLQATPYLLNDSVKVVIPGRTYTVEQGRVTGSVIQWRKGLQTNLCATPAERDMQCIIDQFYASSSGVAGIALGQSENADKLQGPGSRLSRAGSRTSESQGCFNIRRRASVLSLADTTASIARREVLDRLSAAGRLECQEILETSCKTVEELLQLCQAADDALLMNISTSVVKHLCILEAHRHMHIMFRESQNSDRDLYGKEVLTNSENLVQSLAQHREFVRVSSDNPLFTDTASFVKARLNVMGINGICELLCRIRGCQCDDLRVSFEEIVASDVQSLIDQAHNQAGEALRKTRKEALKKVFSYLESIPEKRNKCSNILFMEKIVCEINWRIEQMLVAKLGFRDRTSLLAEMAKLRARSCVADFTFNVSKTASMKKVSIMDELESRMQTLYMRCFSRRPVLHTQVVAVLLEDQTLGREIELLDCLMSFPEEGRNQLLLGELFLEQFTTQLEAHYVQMLTLEERSDRRWGVANSPLLRSLKTIIEQQEYDEENVGF